MYTEEYKEMLIKKFRIILQYYCCEQYTKIDLNNTPFDIIHKKYYEFVKIISR
jgi:hypothetical protein